MGKLTDDEKLNLDYISMIENIIFEAKHNILNGDSELRYDSCVAMTHLYNFAEKELPVRCEISMRYNEKYNNPRRTI